MDAFIESVIPLLEPGDIIIDGGNSNFRDTIRRAAHVESKGLLFIGTGVSGGEEGALKGPSIMPGGSAAAWPHVKEMFQSIAAKVEDGSPCCEWLGNDGAGHFVKMVHNGIDKLQCLTGKRSVTSAALTGPCALLRRCRLPS